MAAVGFISLWGLPTTVHATLHAQGTSETAMDDLGVSVIAAGEESIV
jgi:argininosuccinate synthase